MTDLRAETLTDDDTCALINSVDAALLLDRYAIVTDLAFVSRHNGPIALWTSARPDEVEETVAQLGNVSRTAEAIARATVGRFFGIKIIGWNRGESRSADAVIREDIDALRPIDSGELTDLVRAWFVYSGFPIATHMLVVPKAMAEQDTESVASLTAELESILAVGQERRREIRRNLADDHDLDRQRLLELHTEQTTSLSKTVRKAWLDLLRRTGRAMEHPPEVEPTWITVSNESDSS